MYAALPNGVGGAAESNAGALGLCLGLAKGRACVRNREGPAWPRWGGRAFGGFSVAGLQGPGLGATVLNCYCR